MQRINLNVILACLIITFFFSNAFALDLQKMKVSLLEGDYKQAITEGENILAAQEESRDLDELYYLLGLSYLKDGNYLRASDIFDIIMREFTDSKYKDEARLGMGDAYLLQGSFDKAQSNYEDLLKVNPQTKLKAQVYHRLSQIGFKKGDTEFGKKYLEMLKQEFPGNAELLLNRDLYPESAPIVPSVATASAASNEVFYTVQVGSFSNRLNAENLIQKLNQEEFSAYVEAVAAGQGSESYRVRVGKFSTRQEAVELEIKLAQKGYPTKIVP